MESEGGVVRTDSSRVRVRHRNDCWSGEEAGSAPADGARSHRECAAEARKKTERPRWKLKPAMDFIDAILELDRKAPRKQRHTAHRIWERLQAELPDFPNRRTDSSPSTSTIGNLRWD